MYGEDACRLWRAVKKNMSVSEITKSENRGVLSDGVINEVWMSSLNNETVETINDEIKSENDEFKKLSNNGFINETLLSYMNDKTIDYSNSRIHGDNLSLRFVM
jgi:hypothetical protein